MPDIDFTIPLEYYGYFISAGIAFGVVWCFFGYRIFRFLLGILGFILGALSAGALGFELSEGREVIAIVAAVVGGLLGAGIMFALYIVGVFIIGAALGVLTAFSATAYLNETPDHAIIIIAAVIGGIVSIILKRFMIILATSLSGAWVVVTGLSYYVKTNFDPFQPDSVFRLGEDEIYRILIVWLALAVSGFAVQYITSGRKEEPEDEPISNKPEPVPDETDSEGADNEIIDLDEPYINSASDSPSDHGDSGSE